MVAEDPMVATAEGMTTGGTTEGGDMAAAKAEGTITAFEAAGKKSLNIFRVTTH